MDRKDPCILSAILHISSTMFHFDPPSQLPFSFGAAILFLFVPLWFLFKPPSCFLFPSSFHLGSFSATFGFSSSANFISFQTNIYVDFHNWYLVFVYFFHVLFLLICCSFLFPLVFYSSTTISMFSAIFFSIHDFFNVLCFSSSSWLIQFPLFCLFSTL